MASAVAVPSTTIELVSRLTATDDTPSTRDTARSTWALQAEQDMPSTENCFVGFISIRS